ncbi:MAG: sodium:alanine symporter family protein, partial [Gammaproteobacteria bacterium]|nr:sodium:alanine symporter family protein [Gammaproteobacteria bacterium]
MEQILETINSIIWSKALIALCLGAGLWFSFRTRFMQVRGLVEMTRLTFSGQSSEAGVSSFQALSLSMAGRIGIGNIAGVATAIAFGGPGAIFWMWVMGFLGASTSYIECSLAQIYKEKDNEGRYRGGPAYYIEKGLGLKWYALAFALATLLAAGLLMPGVQANAIADGIANACQGGALCGNLDGQVLGLPSRDALKLGVGIVVAGLLALIIFGGVKRIAAFA